MRRFIKASMPTDSYQEVKKVGNRYVVHFEPETDGDMTTCYECTVDGKPDLTALKEELQVYKDYEARLKRRAQGIQRMAEIIQELEATDYITLKYIDGEDMTEYGDWQARRKALREEYRNLERDISVHAE